MDGVGGRKIKHVQTHFLGFGVDRTLEIQALERAGIPNTCANDK